MFGFLQVLEQNVEALKTFLPELAIVFRPFGDFANGVRLECAKVLASFPMSFNEPGGFEIGEVFGNGLLRNGERGGEFVDRSGTDREPVKDGPPGGVGERGESEAQLIHNQMVVYLWLLVKQLFSPR